jgi:hypothetical protein
MLQNAGDQRDGSCNAKPDDERERHHDQHALDARTDRKVFVVGHCLVNKFIAPCVRNRKQFVAVRLGEHGTRDVDGFVKFFE